MRLSEHPILDFDRGERITFYYNGQEIEGYTEETIAAALHAAGIRRLGHSHELGRPRGLFCAIGNCSFLLYDCGRRTQCPGLRHESAVWYARRGTGRKGGYPE